MESFFHFTVYIYNLLLCVISGRVFYFFVLVCVFLVSDSESGEAFSLASAFVQVRERGSPLFPDASKEKRRACNGEGGGATTPK